MKTKFKLLKMKEIILIPVLIIMFLTMYYWDNQTTFLGVLSAVLDVLNGKLQSLLKGWRLQVL